MSANRFFRELRAVTSAFAVTDEVGKSDGQLQSFLSPRACLALPLCAMFSEGTRHSDVTQTDRQMVHIDTEHERDWQSSNQSLGGPLLLKGAGFSSPLLGSSTSTAWPHMDIKVPTGPGQTSKSLSIKCVTCYEREELAVWLRSNVFSPHMCES